MGDKLYPHSGALTGKCNNHRSTEMRMGDASEENDNNDHDDDCLKDWLRREGQQFVGTFLRSFGKAAAVYVGVQSFTTFMKNPFRKGILVVRQGVLSKDCLRFAAFLGIYPSLYHLTVAVLRRYRRREDGWNYGLAGGVAGLSMALDAASRHNPIAFFAAARALGAGATTLVTRGHVTSVPHAETVAFCVCCAVLLPCVCLHPQLLPTGYYRSVVRWSRTYSEPILTRLFRTPEERFLTCQEVGLHEGTCASHALQDLVRGLPYFARLYFPIHLAPVLLFKRSMLKNRPLYVAKSLARNLTHSSLFLATMVVVARYAICLLRSATGRPPPLPLYIPVVAGSLCGLSVLWERVSRRKELVLFLIPQVLNMLHVLTRDSQWVRGWRVPRGHVLLFAVAMGVVMHAYEREPASLTPLMTGVIRFLVGGRREKKGGGTEGPVKKMVVARHSSEA